MEKKIKILHLEDSQKDSELIHSALKSGEIEFDYFFTDNEKDYLNILEKEHIDLILSDFSLPDYNGNEALKAAREKYPHIPFIFVSGTLGEDAAINSLLSGAMDYVLKNKLERLVPAVNRAMHEQEMEMKRREAEKALKESEEKFRNYIESAPDGVFIVDDTGRYIDVNKSACLIAGYSKQEMEHMSIRELLTDESHEDGLALFENILLKGAITSDLWLKKKDGSKYCITLAAVRLSQKRFLGFAKDITQRKLAEESLIKAKEHAEESDRLKSAFLANMSHEIRTPLNAIVGFSSFFSDPDLRDEDKAKYAEIIKSHSYELLDIINNVLDMARIESGNANVVKRQVMLNDILDKMEQNFRLKLSQNKNANLQLICEKPLPFDQSGLITDADIVKKIFSNLIDNALKFTESGTIRFGYHIPDNLVLTCYVSDTGIGISMENQELIFENFRQATIKDPQKLYGGTGLGLPICKGYLKLLGGKIWVESVPGKGSVFYFNIPYEQFSAEKTRPIQKFDKGPNEAVNNWAGKKFLLVEDDHTNMELLSIFLKQTQAELIFAYNGKEVRQQYDKLDTFDLVLLDIKLPDTSGWDLAREIKSIRPGLPIIAQTAFTQSSDKMKSEEVGCDGHISKPFRKEELFQIITKLLPYL